MKKYASIILDTNIGKLLDYSIPQELIDKTKKGMLVEVPLRNTYRKGYILEIKDKTLIKKTLPIKRIVLDEVITTDVFYLAHFMSRYYLCNISKILKQIIPTSIRKEIDPKSQIFLTAAKSKKELAKLCTDLIRKNPKQAKVLEHFLKAKKGLFLSELLNSENISKSPIDTLIRKKILTSKKITLDQVDFFINQEYFPTKKKQLTKEQQITLQKINKSIENNTFDTHLIYGVTGSGKTEIYLQAIEKALNQNKTAIMLIPEIALTSQTIEKFKARFKEKIAVFNHRKSHGEKKQIWKDLLDNKIKILIGARSAIFVPIKNLGIIIVDEEHDPSYKQAEEMPTYNAKNLSIKRAQLASCPVVLASATPSFESYYNAQNKKYILSTLTKRATKATLPKVTIVDMKVDIEKTKSFTYFSEALLNGIKKRYDLGEQTLIFLNRRGYNTLVQCLNCSTTFKCKHCDIALTYHKKENILCCHLCAYKIPLFKTCPECNSTEYIKYKGFGTEHVEIALKRIFPQIRALRIDRDTTTTKHSHETLLKSFRAGKADVLIGTQMIVKGLHFPAVTLVGVLNTDSAINIPDFRSSENVFQLITQVAGRAGREDLLGEVIIQTYNPNNSTIKLAAKQDYENFYNMEIENRNIFDYPPFSQMVKFVFSSKDENKVVNFSNIFRNELIKNLSNEYKIHPITPSGRAKIKDKFIYLFLIRGKKILPLLENINKVKNKIKLPSSVSLLIDVDPISTFF